MIKKMREIENSIEQMAANTTTRFGKHHKFMISKQSSSSTPLTGVYVNCINNFDNFSFVVTDDERFPRQYYHTLIFEFFK